MTQPRRMTTPTRRSVDRPGLAGCPGCCPREVAKTATGVGQRALAALSKVENDWARRAEYVPYLNHALDDLRDIAYRRDLVATERDVAAVIEDTQRYVQGERRLFGHLRTSVATIAARLAAVKAATWGTTWAG